MVDGEAALALGELVRRRWQSAACETPPPASPSGDPWPQGFEPHFTDNRIGIARTLPLHDDQTEVREVERLFLRSIAAAQDRKGVVSGKSGSVHVDVGGRRIIKKKRTSKPKNT